MRILDFFSYFRTRNLPEATLKLNYFHSTSWEKGKENHPVENCKDIPACNTRNATESSSLMFEMEKLFRSPVDLLTFHMNELLNCIIKKYWIAEKTVGQVGYLQWWVDGWHSKLNWLYLPTHKLSIWKQSRLAIEMLRTASGFVNSCLFKSLFENDKCFLRIILLTIFILSTDLRTAFDLLDRDRDGMVTPTELQFMLRNLGIELSDELIDGLMKEASKTGKLEEFSTQQQETFKALKLWKCDVWSCVNAFFLMRRISSRFYALWDFAWYPSFKCEWSKHATSGSAVRATRKVKYWLRMRIPAVDFSRWALSCFSFEKLSLSFICLFFPITSKA